MTLRERGTRLIMLQSLLSITSILSWDTEWLDSWLVYFLRNLNSTADRWLLSIISETLYSCDFIGTPELIFRYIYDVELEKAVL